MARHSRVVDPRGDACRQIEAAVQVAELERAAREVGTKEMHERAAEHGPRDRPEREQHGVRLEGEGMLCKHVELGAARVQQAHARLLHGHARRHTAHTRRRENERRREHRAGEATQERRRRREAKSIDSERRAAALGAHKRLDGVHGHGQEGEVDLRLLHEVGAAIEA